MARQRRKQKHSKSRTKSQSKQTSSHKKRIGFESSPKANSFEKGVLRLVESSKEPVRVREIERKLAEREEDIYKIKSAVKKLLLEGKLIKEKGRRLSKGDGVKDAVRGKVQSTNGAVGFLLVPNGDDLFITPADMRMLGHGDIVEAVKVQARDGRSRAKVVRLIDRDKSPVIGRYRDMGKRGGLVYPDDPRVPGPVNIPGNMIDEAQEGDRVEVELTHRPRHGEDSRGKVTRVFGNEDDPDARFKALIVQHGFFEEFSDEALAEAESFKEEVNDEEMKLREDLRDLTIFTIDPATARDFDDALSLRLLDNGNYELGVHIADVSFFVRPGSDLERDARKRATSVYTSHGTLPMLPERLSSNLCSLREGVDRRTMSCFMEMDSSGKMIQKRVARTLIHSKRRFTYREVQDYLDGESSALNSELKTLDETSIDSTLLHLAALARKLRRIRFKIGGINLDVPEYEIILSSTGRVEAIKRREVIESNKLVEECMLAANRAVTEIAVRERKGGPQAFVYRVHDKPDPDKLEEYSGLVQVLDIPWPFGKRYNLIKSREINDWIATLADHPLAGVIRIHLLRSMAKATYTIENIGHYGLGFANYTHFTSPIRRLPDILVHRLLLEHIESNGEHSAIKAGSLERDCLHSSEREKAASEMERASLKIRQAEYFEQHLGEQFEGLITNAQARGMFVEIVNTGASGFISADELQTAWFDRQLKAFVEIGSQKIWQPGQKIMVNVTRVDKALGLIDLELAQERIVEKV